MWEEGEKIRYPGSEKSKRRDLYCTPKNHDVVAHGQSKHTSKVKGIPSETQM